MMKLQPVAAAALLAVCLGSTQAAEPQRATAVAPAKGHDRGAPAAGPAEASLAYTVQQRDTLIGLGRTVLVSPAAWRDVARFNRLRNPNVIATGQRLQLPLRLLRSTEPPASIISTEGDVRVAGAPAAAGVALNKGQTLSTGAAGSAVVRLGDGSRVKVAPSTELSVSEHRRFELKAGSVVTPGAADEGVFASTMRLVRGSVELLASKVLRAKPLEVQTPTAVIGVRGTEYRVHHDQDAANPTRTEVLEGQVRADVVAVAAAGSAGGSEANARGGLGADVPAGFGAALQAASPPTLAKLSAAPDLAGLPARFERPVVRLPLAGESQALRLQVAADAAFDRLVRDQRVAAGSEARITGLEDGRWYLRVRRIDGAGIEGYDAAREFVLKARPEPPATTLPQARQKLPVGALTLSWAENTQAARYALQVSRNAGFTEGVQRVDALLGAQTQLTLNDAGGYFWRMASVRADGDQGPWGDPQQFELRPLPTPPTGGLSADGSTLELSWSGREQDRHQVELAQDLAFTEIVSRDELAQSRWALPVPAAGRYYFRYRSVEADGFVTPWSETLKLEVPRGWGFLWLAVPLLFAL